MVSGGVRIPILFANHVHVRGLNKGAVRVCNPSRFGVRIGFGGTLGITRNHSIINIADGGSISFNGRASFCEGTVMRVDGGYLEFGDNFSCNKNCAFFSRQDIVFGDNCLLGWNVTLRNSDGHTIFGPDGQINNKPANVHVGNHVWIAANVDVFKGSRIPDGCVISGHSLVTKRFDDPNSLIGGIPAKIIRRDISWQH